MQNLSCIWSKVEELKTWQDYSMTDAAGDPLRTEKGRQHYILSTSAARMDVPAIAAPQTTDLKQACQ